MQIVAATGNIGKLKEIEKIFSELGFSVITQSQAGINVSPEENGKTFIENALIKARATASLCNDYVIADDSGLCVNALGGRPGVHSARYAGEGASDAEKIKKLLSEMEDKSERSAYFKTAVVLITPSGEEIIAEGEVHGHILKAPDGENGFGYDPVFYCDEIKKSFANASADEKNSVSHRGRALRTLYEKLNSKEK